MATKVQFFLTDRLGGHINWATGCHSNGDLWYYPVNYDGICSPQPATHTIPSPCNGPETSDVVVFTINNGIGQAAYCAILTNSDAPNAHADHDLPRPNGSADMGYPQGNNI